MKQSRYLVLLAFVAGCGDGAVAPAPGVSEHPDGATFVTTDIVHFWEAYDAGGKDGNSSAFQTQYLDRASDGLRDFIPSRSVTAGSLSSMVRTFPQYFAAIKGNMLSLASQPAILARIRQNYDSIEAMYPNAVYPPVTFLVGRFSTAGTIRQSGMIIGMEFFSIDASTPLAELTPFARNNVQPLDSIPLIVAHEHVHVLQGYAQALLTKSNATLLEKSLLEGSADFIGELIAGGHINKNAHAYGLANEQQLWSEFQAVMNGTNISQWLYNQGNPPAGRPGDLGYFIGYRITKAFYDKTADKKAAVRAIIEATDGLTFLAASGYAP